MEGTQRPLALTPLLDAAPFPDMLMPRMKSASDEAAVRKRVRTSLVPPLPGFPASTTVASFEAESKVDSVEPQSAFGSDAIEFGTLDETGRSTSTKSALYRRFLTEIRSRAVHAPGRRDSAASGLPRVMPRPVSDHSTSRASMLTTGRQRPASAAGISQSRIASSASARLSTTEVHHVPPVLYSDGVKHGSFVTLQAQFDKLRHGGVSASRSSLPANAVAAVPANLRKIFDPYTSVMPCTAKLISKPRSFDTTLVAHASCCVAETMAMLRDMGIIPYLVSKTEASQALSCTVAASGRTGSSLLLSEALFPELLIRIALIVEPATLRELMGDCSPQSAEPDRSIIGALSGMASALRISQSSNSAPAPENDVIARVSMFVQCLGLNDAALVKKFTSAVIAKHRVPPPRAWAAPLDRPATIGLSAHSTLLASACAQRRCALPARMFRDSSERVERLAASRADFSKSLLDVLLLSRSPHQFKFASVSADLDATPVWCNNDDLFLDMSGLKISNRYRYRIVVVNAARAPVQIRAVSVGLPDCITIKHSALLFVPGASISVSIVCKPSASIEALGFVDVHSTCPSQSDDIEVIRCPVFVQTTERKTQAWQ